MTRQASYEANVELMEEMGELDGCEAFQLLDEESDSEQEAPIWGQVWRGERVRVPDVVKGGEEDDDE